MKSKYSGLLIAVVASSIFLGGCTLKPNSTSPSDKGANNTDQTQGNKPTDETVNPSGQYTVNELLTMNKPMKCSWKENATGDSDVTNIIYIDGHKFYQDVTMGDLGHSFTISDGDYLYLWSDFNDVASKMKNTGVATNINQDKISANPSAEPKRDFICEKWSVDNSIFTPPQNKTFKDVTEEMNQAVQNLGNGGLEKAKKQACDLCQGAPTTELKNQCLTNAQCND
jgi:hypothetical protein